MNRCILGTACENVFQLYHWVMVQLLTVFMFLFQIGDKCNKKFIDCQPIWSAEGWTNGNKHCSVTNAGQSSIYEGRYN